MVFDPDRQESKRKSNWWEKRPNRIDWGALRGKSFSVLAISYDCHYNDKGFSIYCSAFLGRKNMPGPIPSGYGVVPSAVMDTFIGTVSEGE